MGRGESMEGFADCVKEFDLISGAARPPECAHRGVTVLICIES